MRGCWLVGGLCYSIIFDVYLFYYNEEDGRNMFYLPLFIPFYSYEGRYFSYYI